MHKKIIQSVLPWLLAVFSIGAVASLAGATGKGNMSVEHRMLGFAKALKTASTYGEVLILLEKDGYSQEFVGDMRKQFAKLLNKKLPKREITISEKGLPPNAKIKLASKLGTLTINYYADTKKPLKIQGVTFHSSDVSLADGDLVKKFLTVPFFKRYLDNKAPTSWLEKQIPFFLQPEQARATDSEGDIGYGIFSGTPIVGPIPELVAFMVGGVKGLLTVNPKSGEALQLRAPASAQPEASPHQ